MGNPEVEPLPVLGRIRWPIRTGSGNEGFALVDALTGLTILATTIVFAIGAADVSRRAAMTTAELRDAAPAVEYLADIAFVEPGVKEGATGNLKWIVSLAPDSSHHTGEVCLRTVKLQHIGKPRGQTLSTLEPCPADQG